MKVSLKLRTSVAPAPIYAVDAEEHDIPVTIASTEEQETASEETSPEESALYEDSENVEEIATPESAQPASDSTIPLEESEYAQEVA